MGRRRHGAEGRSTRGARLGQPLAAAGHSASRGPERRLGRREDRAGKAKLPPILAPSLRHPLPLPPMGPAHAPDLRHRRRALSRLWGQDEAPRPRPRLGEHRALPAPPGPLVPAPRARPGPRPALPARRHPPSPLPTRKAQLRYVSLAMAMGAQRPPSARRWPAVASLARAGPREAPKSLSSRASLCASQAPETAVPTRLSLRGAVRIDYGRASHAWSVRGKSQGTGHRHRRSGAARSRSRLLPQVACRGKVEGDRCASWRL